MKRERQEEEDSEEKEDFETLGELGEHYVSKIEELDDQRKAELEECCWKMLFDLMRVPDESLRDYMFKLDTYGYVNTVLALLNVEIEEAEEIWSDLEDDSDFYCGTLRQWQGEMVFRLQELADPNLPFMFDRNIALHQAERLYPSGDESKNQELMEQYRTECLMDKTEDQIRQKYVDQKLFELYISGNYPKDDPKLTEEENLKRENLFEQEARSWLEKSDLESASFLKEFDAKYKKIKR